MDVSLNRRIVQQNEVSFPHSWSSILDILRPVHVNVFEGEQRNYSTFHGLFTRWSRLYAVIQAHERRVANKYTWVIRTRPDLLYSCRLSRALLEQMHGHTLLKWDFVAVLPRDAAGTALTIGSQSVTCRCEAMVDMCIPSVLYAHGFPFLHSVNNGAANVSAIVNIGDSLSESFCETLPPAAPSQLDSERKQVRSRRCIRREAITPEQIAVVLRLGHLASTSGIANDTATQCMEHMFRHKSGATLHEEYDDASCRTQRALRVPSRAQLPKGTTWGDPTLTDIMELSHQLRLHGSHQNARSGSL